MSTAEEDARELLEDAVGEDWTSQKILEDIQRSYDGTITPKEAQEEAEIWREQYDLEPLEARRYAEAFLSYDEDVSRDEFEELVDDWNYSS